MKKIFSFVVLALAVSLAFTGCASKKAKDAKGPKTFRVDIGSAVESIAVGTEEVKINVSSLLPEGAAPVVGDKVRIMWSAMSDADLGVIYVSCGDNSEEQVLIENVAAGQSFYASVTLPIDLDVAGPLFITIRSDTEAVLKVSYFDAK